MISPFASRPGTARRGPCLIDATNGPWPLHDTTTSRAVEACLLSQPATERPMQRAGAAVARLALALAGGRTIDVWAGPGNNGGDGLMAASLLRAAGQDVQARLLGDPARLPEDAALALHQAQAAGVVFVPAGQPLRARSLAIDALLGLGAKRAPEGAIAAAIRAVNATTGPVLAVDLPSGLNPDTGQILGQAAVLATATLSLLTLKPGCFTALGRDHAGTVWLDRLGAEVTGPTAWLTGPPQFEPRAHSSHKGSFGDVAVVGGAQGMTGAAWLAARAALAAGAGRVYCSPLDPDASLLDMQHPELMGRTGWWRSGARALAATTVCCGCGGGSALGDVLPPLLSGVARLVLDADALNAIAAQGTLQNLLRLRARRGMATLLTPHPLEAARLMRLAVVDVQADRLAAAQTLAHQFQSAVLLKGSGTVIASPGVLPCINPTGNAGLATAGTGDVLAGWAAGLWAQRPGTDTATLACWAAWQHGRAADWWVQMRPHESLRASDLIESMAQGARG